MKTPAEHTPTIGTVMILCNISREISMHAVYKFPKRIEYFQQLDLMRGFLLNGDNSIFNEFNINIIILS